MMSWARQCARLSALAVIVLLASGCGKTSPGKVHVNGNVTFNGNPLEAGSIIFTEIEGNHVQAGGEISRGRYSVNNVAPGKNKITIQGGSANAVEGGAAEHAKRGREIQHKAGEAFRHSVQQGKKVLAEAMGGEGGLISDKTMGNNQVQEISSDRNQTIDISLKTATRGP